MLRNSQQDQEPSHQRSRVNADANPNPKQDGCQSHVWRTEGRCLHFLTIAMTTSQLLVTRSSSDCGAAANRAEPDGPSGRSRRLARTNHPRINRIQNSAGPGFTPVKLLTASPGTNGRTRRRTGSPATGPVVAHRQRDH